MSEDQNSALQKATDLVNSGNFNEALESARTALTSDPNNGDAKLIEAISLSQLGNNRDASEAFSEAVRLSPTNVKARFNAAVHEFNCGNVGEARNLANQALSIDPDHEGTRVLVERMGPEQVQMTPGASYPRENMAGFEPPHEGIAFIRSSPKVWTAMGWLISGLSLVFCIYFWASIIPHVSELVDAANSKNPTASSNQIASKISNPVLSFGPYIMVLANLVWMIMDIIHRRGNFVWLIIHIPASCIMACIGGNFITLPIYMIFGRK